MSFVSRRSPWRVPAPPGPDDGPKPDDALLRLLLSAAWRSRALAVSLAAGMGRIPDGEAQRSLHARVGCLLDSSVAAAALAAERGLEDGETCIAARLESGPLPTCASWAEAALADETFGRALEDAWRELADSADEALAALGRENGPGRGCGEAPLAALAEDAKNRDCLQILVDRWLPASVRVFGRPANGNELALLESRIKPRSSEEALAAFLADTEARLGALGLWLPDAARMGVTVPAGWTPRRGSRD
jgi:hypothetical protein